MMFSLTPMVVHDVLAVGRVDQHPGDRAGARLRVEHAHLEVGEVDVRELGERDRRSPPAARCRAR